MSLAEDINNFFARISSQEFDALLDAAEFDKCNASGSNIMSPSEALALAAQSGSTYTGDVMGSEAGPVDRGWDAPSDGLPLNEALPSGNYEEMPMAA